ncbi:DUF1801 domain-containing protein [Rhodococcus rhodochrous]|uniref:DUF1801 domain-containing protein n=1 Tax=Rhodococcus rhodochrous TaxID=1829 RepID=A0AA46WXE4_RHORH|nr:DUF1801 domain-containing protein [Rhodococcus rhodochrous]MCD2110299.1 DUF1801 domain-containing protein [Rhodococcus rhodochrous]UZF45887.1 DUF1801 domain-containing protein [Rhodococcus rhodochrous]
MERGDRETAAMVAAGWTVCLDEFDALPAGEPPSQETDSEAWRPVYELLHRRRIPGGCSRAGTRRGDLMSESEKGTGPKLLSGGNPQIPKGMGREPVEAYIAAMPEWKHDIGRRLDELIREEVPDVHNAVKWNQPLYGTADDSWFLTFRCFTNYVQLSFFRGSSLDPLPEKGSKHPEMRYHDIRRLEDLDEDKIRKWVRQAAELPGEKM